MDLMFTRGSFACPVTIDDLTYPSADVALLALRCASPAQRRFFTDASPAEARRLAERATPREDWATARRTELERVLRAKFTNQDLRKRLAETGDAELGRGDERAILEAIRAEAQAEFTQVNASESAEDASRSVKTDKPSKRKGKADKDGEATSEKSGEATVDDGA